MDAECREDRTTSYRLTARVETAAGAIVIHGTATVLLDDVPDLLAGDPPRGGVG